MLELVPNTTIPISPLIGQPPTPEIGIKIFPSNLSSKIDLDIPIAISKCVSTCTKHLLSNHVSYHRLYPTYKAFTTNLSLELIPNSIQEAHAIPN